MMRMHYRGFPTPFFTLNCHYGQFLMRAYNLLSDPTSTAQLIVTPLHLVLLIYTDVLFAQADVRSTIDSWASFSF